MAQIIPGPLVYLWLAFHKWGLGKQCKPILDATERGALSASTCFAQCMEKVISTMGNEISLTRAH